MPPRSRILLLFCFASRLLESFGPPPRRPIHFGPRLYRL